MLKRYPHASTIGRILPGNSRVVVQFNGVPPISTIFEHPKGVQAPFSQKSKGTHWMIFPQLGPGRLPNLNQPPSFKDVVSHWLP